MVHRDSKHFPLTLNNAEVSATHSNLYNYWNRILYTYASTSQIHTSIYTDKQEFVSWWHKYCYILKCLNIICQKFSTCSLFTWICTQNNYIHCVPSPSARDLHEHEHSLFGVHLKDTLTWNMSFFAFLYTGKYSTHTHICFSFSVNKRVSVNSEVQISLCIWIHRSHVQGHWCTADSRLTSSGHLMSTVLCGHVSNPLCSVSLHPQLSIAVLLDVLLSLCQHVIEGVVTYTLSGRNRTHK